MAFDLATLMAINAAVTISSGAVFVLNTIFRRYDRAGRIWTVGFIAGMLTSISYLVWAVFPGLGLVVVIGNATYLLSVAMIWSGARAFNGRRALVWIPGIAALLVVIATIVEYPVNADWAGSGVLFALMGLSLAAVTWEALRGAMGTNLNSRIFAGVSATVGLFFLLRAIAVSVWGPFSPFFLAFFSSEIATYVVTVMMVAAVTSLSLIRAEQHSMWWAVDTGSPASDPALRSPAEFEAEARDRLARAGVRGERSVMLAIRLDNLAEMNTAFGRSYGDAAIATLATVIRRNVPAGALIARDNAGAFRVLFEFLLETELDRIVSDIRGALLDTQNPDSKGYRVTAAVGVAETNPGALDYDELNQRAAAAASVVREQ